MSACSEVSGKVPTLPPVIVVKALRKFSLHDVEFTVQPSERVAIIGESGSGKSVLLGCILGQLHPEAGSVSVLGRRIAGRIRTIPGLGVSFQQPGLIDAWDVSRNLGVASGEHVGEEDLRSHLDATGLDEVSLEERTSDLSGGQKKRIAIVRALLRGSRLVVLDEPTSGLDPFNATHVSSFLQEKLAERGVAVLIVTHDYRVARQVAERILLLADGTLRDVTPPADLSAVDQVRWLERKLEESSTVTDAEEESPGRSPRWGFLSNLAGLLSISLPLAASTMALLGALLVTQSSGVSPIPIDRSIPGMVVSAVFRELAPLVVGLLLAGWIGARISAQVAGMGYTSQLDSMRLLGISPERHLLLPYAASAAITFPLCILAGAFSAVVGGGLIAMMPLPGLQISMLRYFHLAVGTVDSSLILSCVLKGILMGLAVSCVAYRYGTLRVRDAQRLGSTVTQSTVVSAVAVILVDVVLSFLFFTGG